MEACEDAATSPQNSDFAANRRKFIGQNGLKSRLKQCKYFGINGPISSVAGSSPVVPAIPFNRLQDAPSGHFLYILKTRPVSRMVERKLLARSRVRSLSTECDGRNAVGPSRQSQSFVVGR